MLLLKVLLGTVGHDARWKTCSVSVMFDFGMALGRLFVEETFDKEAKQMVGELCKL